VARSLEVDALKAEGGARVEESMSRCARCGSTAATSPLKSSKLTFACRYFLL
jgi:hypothetical protein